MAYTLLCGEWPFCRNNYLKMPFLFLFVSFVGAIAFVVMFVKRSRRRRMDIRPKEVALDAEASREASDFSGTEIRDCIDNDRGLPFLLGSMDREDGFFSHALLIQNQLWYHRNELADDLKESISNYVSTLYRRHSEALSPYARTSLRYKIEVPTFDVHGYDCQNELRGYELALDYIDSFVSKVDLSCPLSPERGVDGIPAIHIYGFGEKETSSFLSSTCVRCGAPCETHVEWPVTRDAIEKSLCPACRHPDR